MSEEKQEHKPKPKMIEVRTVKTTGKSVIVEYTEKGATKRAIMPVDSIKDGKVDSETLSLGIPYGIDWSKLELNQVTAEQLATELHKNDIWTREDVQKNPAAVQGALQKLIGLNLGKIYQVANSHKKE